MSCLNVEKLDSMSQVKYPPSILTCMRHWDCTLFKVNTVSDNGRHSYRVQVYRYGCGSHIRKYDIVMQSL